MDNMEDVNLRLDFKVLKTAFYMNIRSFAGRNRPFRTSWGIGLSQIENNHNTDTDRNKNNSVGVVSHA